MRRLLLVFVTAFFAVGLASQVEAQTRPYSQTVDNATKGRFAAPGSWGTSQGSEQRFGADYRFARPAKVSEAARFKVRIPKTGSYDVYARWPAKSTHNSAAPIGVQTTSGMKWTRVNQQKNGGRWVKVGTFRLQSGDASYVRFSRQSSRTGLVVADAVRVVEAPTSTASARQPDSLLGAPLHSQARVERYARSVGATRYIMETIPHYYKLAPKTGIAPDVLVAQAMLETGNGRYGGDSKPWNMAGIKKGGVVGDEPRDFERPATAYEGVRMHVNHMAAYAGKKPIGTPHARYYDARAAQQNRGWWVSRVSQLGGGVWATDTQYAGKIRRILDDMGKH